MDAALIVNHILDHMSIANPDGSVPADIQGCTLVAGPGSSPAGVLPKALHFGGAGRILVNPDFALFDPRAFCVRLVFRVTAPVADRMNLFEGGRHGCSVQVAPSDGLGQYRLVATIENSRNGWAGTDTLSRRDLKLDTWYRLVVAFDLDTLGFFLDDELVAVTAFPNGEPASRDSAAFVIGVHPDLERWPFVGDMALVQMWSGLPRLIGMPVDQVLDDARGGAEWHIRLKENTLLPDFDFGWRNGDITSDAASGMSLQRFAASTIGYGLGLPSAHIMYGLIRERWERANLGALLGPMVSDEEPAQSDGARRNVFEKGAIYWSPSSGAWEIPGRPSLDYEIIGGSASVLGVPVAAPETIDGGMQQRFQHGRLYFEDGTGSANEVHGDILQHYLDKGGPDAFGFPVSDEQDVYEANTGMMLPNPTGARMSRFSLLDTVIVWGAATGAHDVREALSRAYFAVGGPGLPFDSRFNGLGLPIGDHTKIPGPGNLGWFSLFEHGSIVRRGGRTRVCPAFQIRLGLVETKEDEGAWQGQNDLYFKITLSKNGIPIWSKRIPNDGAFDGDNSHELDLLLDPVLTPNDPALRVLLQVEVWDADKFFGGGDNHLGTFDTELNLANCWGMLDDPSGYQVPASFAEVKLFAWAVVPRWLPNAAPDFFEETNQGTPSLTYDQYAAAFSDVDDDPEWTDPADWANRDVFARRVKTSAASGNCFGFCTEALHAWHGRGVGMPLRRFAPGSWPLLKNTINIKQIYWFGSDNLCQVHQQQEDGITPGEVFQRTWDRWNAGNPSVINMFSQSAWNGAGHAVLPFAWDNTTTPWTIRCFDPNAGNSPATIFVNPNNTFSFSNRGVVMQGSMSFSSWSSLDHRQTSPAWDPKLLLCALLIVAVGAAAQTESLVDTMGDNLWMPDNPRRERTAGRGQFAPVNSPDGQTDGEILLRSVRQASAIPFGAGDPVELRFGDFVRRAALRDQTGFAQKAPLAGGIPGLPNRLARRLSAMQLTPELASVRLRDILHQIGPAADLAQNHPELGALGTWLNRQSSQNGPDFVHRLKGVRNGRFDYLLRWRLTTTAIRSAIAANERHQLEARGLATDAPVHRLVTERDKLVSIEHTVRVGRTAEFMRVALEGLSCRAAVPLAVSIRPGLAAVDVVSAGDRVEVPVRLETWRGADRREERFLAIVEGGVRISALIKEPGAALRQAPIKTLFGTAGAAISLNPLV